MERGRHGHQTTRTHDTYPSPERHRLSPWCLSLSIHIHNLTDTRTERMVNPRAWDSGMVFVQCGDPACAAWHKVADAAGLVEEIRFDTEPAPLAAPSGAAALEFEAPAEPHALVVKGEEVVGLVPVEGEGVKEA